MAATAFFRLAGVSSASRLTASQTRTKQLKITRNFLFISNLFYLLSANFYSNFC
jgi:hypothetical protein